MFWKLEETSETFNLKQVTQNVIMVLPLQRHLFSLVVTIHFPFSINRSEYGQRQKVFYADS